MKLIFFSDDFVVTSVDSSHFLVFISFVSVWTFFFSFRRFSWFRSFWLYAHVRSFKPLGCCLFYFSFHFRKSQRARAHTIIHFCTKHLLYCHSPDRKVFSSHFVVVVVVALIVRHLVVRLRAGSLYWFWFLKQPPTHAHHKTFFFYSFLLRVDSIESLACRVLV